MHNVDVKDSDSQYTILQQACQQARARGVATSKAVIKGICEVTTDVLVRSISARAVVKGLTTIASPWLTTTRFRRVKLTQ